MKVSRSTGGLQNQINLLHKYSEKWLLTTNLKKTKTKLLIFLKENRKSTRDEYHSFLNGNEIYNAQEYTYLGTTFYSNGNFSISKHTLAEKLEDQFLHVRNISTLVSSRHLCAISFLVLFSYLCFSTAQKSGEYTTTLTLRMRQRPHRKTAYSILQILHRLKQESPKRCIP